MPQTWAKGIKAGETSLANHMQILLVFWIFIRSSMLTRHRFIAQGFVRIGQFGR